MPKEVAPFYSKTGAVYHIFSACTAGKAIKKSKKVSGKGGRKLCVACKDIKAGKRTR
jgi:hypothetical protein